MFAIDIHKLLHQFVYDIKAPMIFNSGFFLLLFAVFLLIYLFLHKTKRAKMIFVALFSFYFYYKSSGFYFYLLIISIIVDYYLAYWISITKHKKRRLWLLVFSLVVNLGLLAYFKYTNFFYEIFCNISNLNFKGFDIFLPVGISFFTFQSLSYTIDVYRKEIKPVKSILDYAFFVSFFPQLVAGPIVRAKDFLPQINLPTIVTREMFGRAIFLITIGLFKKAVISDYISLNFVDRIFDNPMLYTGIENLFGVYAYAMQIYCDFSGYSDMAIGIALLLGFHFNINFNSPYKSSSITEFWRRWHISLSTWLRDYLYISMGGNRKGKVRTYLNLFITMLVGGIWHGAAFKFILWGALHGTALGIEKFVKSIFTMKKNRISKIIGIILTFHFVCFCWIFFRSADMNIASQMITRIFTAFNSQVFLSLIIGYKWVMLLLAIGFMLHFSSVKLETKAQELVIRMPLLIKALLLVGIIFLVMQVKSSDIQPFIYFQF